MTTVLNPKSIVDRFVGGHCRRRATLCCDAARRAAANGLLISAGQYARRYLYSSLTPPPLGRVSFTPTQRGKVYLAGCHRRRVYCASQFCAKKKN